MPLLLTQDDLRSLLESPGALEGAFAAVETAFREYQRGEARNQDGLLIPLAGAPGGLRVLPGSSPASGASLKLYPWGARPHIDSRVNLLFDAEDGHLLALMAGDDLNVFRTAVPAGVGARYLAPSAARRIALMGTGRQARGQLLALRHALPSAEDVLVFSPTPEHRRAFAADMSSRAGVAVREVDSARAALEDADVIGVASSSQKPVFEAEWVRPGALVVSIAAGQLPSGIVARARVIAACRDELASTHPGHEPYASLTASGAWGPERIAGELGEVVLGTIPAREREEETVIYEMAGYKSLVFGEEPYNAGMSVWDTAILRAAYDRATANGVGTEFHLSTG